MLRAPTSSTRDHQPRDATRGRLRTPPTTTGKLRLTRRAWLLLWLTATLIALADGGLLLRGASVTMMLEGRTRSLPAGLTVAQALEHIGRPAAGDLLAVDHSVLHKGAYPPTVLVNGQPVPGTRRLQRGDRVTIVPGRSRIEPVTRVSQQLAANRPGNPMRSLATGPAQAVLDRGQQSGRMMPVAFHPAAGTAGSLPVALTFDDGPWPHSTQQILAILVQRQAPATFFVVGRQVERYPELVRRELVAGMAVGSHSYGHPQPFDRLPVARIRDEIVHGRRTLVPLEVRPGGIPAAGRGHHLDRDGSRPGARGPYRAVERRPGRLAARRHRRPARLAGAGRGRGRSCCCTTVGGTGRRPWPPCRPSSMGCAAWASP